MAIFPSTVFSHLPGQEASIQQLIDLHCHIVPGVDDGPATWEESTQLFSQMKEQMTRPAVLVATPHFRLSTSGRVFSSQSKRILEFLSFANRSRIEDEFSVLAAREVMLDRWKPSANALDVLCLPGTSWVLVEHSFNMPWIFALFRIRAVLRQGFRPLLAHPERYSWCRTRPERISRLSEMGAGIQVCAKSLSGTGVTAETAWRLIESGMVHVLSSDAHHPGDNLLSEELKHKVDRVAPGAYNLLTGKMPETVLNNCELPQLPLMT